MLTLLRRLAAIALPRGPIRALAARGSTLLIGQVGAALLAVVETVVLARALGVSGYGELALVIATVTVVLMIVDVRVWETATRFGVDFVAQDRPAHARAVLELSIALNAAVGVVAAAATLGLAGLVSELFLRTPEATDALRLYALVAPFTAVAVAASGVLRVLDAYRTLTALTVVVPLFRAIAAAAGFALGWGLLEFVGALAAAEAAGSVVFAILSLRKLDHSLATGVPVTARFRLLRPYFRRMGRFLALSSAVGSVRILNERADLLLVGYLTNPATVGVFKLARTFTQPLGMFAKPYFQVIYPQLTHAAARGQLAELRRLAYRSTVPLVGMLLPMAAAICVACPLAIPAIAGSSFDASSQAVIPLAAGWVISGGFCWVHPSALALDAQKLLLGALVTATALQMGLLVLLVPSAGAVGAALAWLAFIGAFITLMVIALRRRLGKADAALPDGRLLDGAVSRWAS